MQEQMTRRTWLTGSLALGMIIGSLGGALHAQPNPGAAPNAAQPADYRNLTPEQQQQIAQQVRDFAREQTLRLMMNNAGVTDKAQQDAVIAFAKEQQDAAQPLRDQQRKLMQALRTQGTTDAQVNSALGDFAAAGEDETQRRRAALEALEAKVNYSTHPRLAAVLTTMGLLGDEMAVAGDTGGMGGGFGGMGGRGGGQGGMGGFGGGGQGGMGGRGGGQGGMGNGRRGGRGRGNGGQGGGNGQAGG